MTGLLVRMGHRVNQETMDSQVKRVRWGPRVSEGPQESEAAPALQEGEATPPRTRAPCTARLAPGGRGGTQARQAQQGALDPRAHLGMTL